MAMNEVPCERCSCKCRGCYYGPCMCWLNGEEQGSCADCDYECEKSNRKEDE